MTSSDKQRQERSGSDRAEEGVRMAVRAAEKLPVAALIRMRWSLGRRN